MQLKIQAGAIHRYCQREGISRAELARRLGVTDTTAYRIDKGETPSARFIAAFMTETGSKFEEAFELVPEEVPA